MQESRVESKGVAQRHPLAAQLGVQLLGSCLSLTLPLFVVTCGCQAHGLLTHDAVQTTTD